MLLSIKICCAPMKNLRIFEIIENVNYVRLIAQEGSV